MNRGLRLAVGVALAVVSTGRAAAQDTEIGSHVVKERNIVSTRDNKAASRLESYEFMRCLVRHRSPLAANYLRETTPAEYDRLATALFREVSSCPMIGFSDFATARQYRWSGDVGRGMIAEALLAAMPPRATPAALPLGKDYHSPWTMLSERAPVVEEMAVCVAATAPAGIESLLATTMGSVEEGAAVRALAPAMGLCLQVGAKLTANRASIRGALAEALYHRVAGDAPAGAGTP